MSEPAPTVWPTLRARDARGLIRFLVDAFGFEEVVTYGDQPDGSGDTVVHAELAWPLGGGLMLGSVREGADEWALAPGTCGCYVITDYDSRDFAAQDPEGNRWSFGTYRGSPRP
jgi:uncharacterized glyoxalase superfamily protein PhnB